MIRMQTRERRLIVTLHDVAPPFEAVIRAQLAALGELGVDRCVLKVVPNWHGRYPIDESPTLAACLREAASAGSEIVLHGFEHGALGPLRGSLINRVRGRVFAPGVAEFLTLDPAKAFRAISDGLSLVERAGLPRPAGFCAPGWLMSGETRDVLRDAGMRYVLTMFSIDDLAAGKRVYIPAIGTMGAGGAHELGIQILDGIVGATWARGAETVKVYLHPQGGMESPHMQRALRAAASLARHRSVTTCARLLGEADGHPVAS
jgi:predicted deacetylase